MTQIARFADSAQHTKTQSQTPGPAAAARASAISRSSSHRPHLRVLQRLSSAWVALAPLQSIIQSCLPPMVLPLSSRSRACRTTDNINGPAKPRNLPPAKTCGQPPPRCKTQWQGCVAPGVRHPACSKHGCGPSVAARTGRRRPLFPSLTLATIHAVRRIAGIHGPSLTHTIHLFASWSNQICPPASSVHLHVYWSLDRAASTLGRQHRASTCTYNGRCAEARCQQRCLLMPAPSPPSSRERTRAQPARGCRSARASGICRGRGCTPHSTRRRLAHPSSSRRPGSRSPSCSSPA